MVNCAVLVASEPLPEMMEEPDALVKRPVPPEYVSGPLKITSGPSAVSVPVHVEKS